MLEILNNKVYLCCILLVLIVSLYYFIDYKTRNVVRDELRELRKQQMRRMRVQEQRSRQVMTQDRQDLDSYIDPAENKPTQDDNPYQDQDQDDQEEQQVQKKPRRRISQQDIMQRDLVDQ